MPQCSRRVVARRGEWILQRGEWILQRTRRVVVCHGGWTGIGRTDRPARKGKPKRFEGEAQYGFGFGV